MCEGWGPPTQALRGPPGDGTAEECGGRLQGTALRGGAREAEVDQRHVFAEDGKGQ